ncbi:uncharacterized protein PHALS_11806 [Plasmopara halstedii]|uniref:Uncharacterized protein n=1 Tax=Plasmopara halstedii TaxID=4781 RepID=A0A0P1AKL0_PLAHL|nr:uncharacterized protein PHALS_11806 [Plasmopara halstedii]CEG41461.1 hypothetical protein PHALS_11806 [Plasmopara halstedii]|eukprot:XP_024577830.1 hypothetical protein PHALS_11806 [Plasmopara halstedii]
MTAKVGSSKRLKEDQNQMTSEYVAKVWTLKQFMRAHNRAYDCTISATRL